MDVLGTFIVSAIASQRRSSQPRGSHGVGLMLGFGLLCIFRPDLDAGVISARSVALADVATAVALARDGDTIAIPAGSATWSGQLSMTKCVTLVGAGINDTLITTSFAGGSTVPQKGAIRFAVTTDMPFGLRNMSIRHTSTGTQTLWIVGGTGGIANPRIPGISTQWRMADVAIVNGNQIQSHFENVIGVTDHCTLDSGNQFVQVLHPAWPQNGRPGANGHGSWSSPVNWGSGDFLFWEDCTISYTGTSSGVLFGTDGYAGARYVVRHCTLNKISFTNHGTETHYARGTRAGECYNNIFTGGNGTMAEWRSGTLIAHNNICGGYGQGWALRNHRNFLIKDLGAVMGVNLFDQNTALDTSGNPTNGNIAPDAATGTVSSRTSGNITDNTKSWTAHQWQTNNASNPSLNSGYIYEIVNMSDATYSPAPIMDNTVNTIIYYAWSGSDSGGQKSLDFSNGQKFAIRKVYAALDQPGRGLSDPMSGYPPSPPFWPHQRLDPCYSWNNWSGGKFSGGGTTGTVSGSVGNTQLDLHVEQGQLKEGRDFFNGTAKPGYAPYTYPHPLSTAPLAPLRPPTNLQVTPQ